MSMPPKFFSRLFVLLFFGYLDYRLFPRHYLTIWTVRGLCAACVVSVFGLSYTSYYRRFMQPIMALGTVLCGVLAVAMMYITRGDPFSACLASSPNSR